MDNNRLRKLVKQHLRIVLDEGLKKECTTQILTHYDSFDCVDCKLWEVCCRYKYGTLKGRRGILC